MDSEECYTSQRTFLQKIKNLRWGGEIYCYRCGGRRISLIPSEERFHCNVCFSSFGVLSGTVFHNTRLPISKWVEAIEILSSPNGHKISSRKLAKRINVNKDTANRMINKIRSRWHVKSEKMLMLNLINKGGEE